MRRRTTSQPRIALALAGGGPLGAIYEIGALCALEESLDGLALHRLDHYVGVSAGGFIAAGLANGMTARELCAAFIDPQGGGDVFDPAWLMVPAYGEFLRRGLMVPGLAASALWRATLGRKSILSSLERLGPSLPTGLFSSEEIDRRLADLFSRPGRTNDFRRLRTRLTLVATHLDTGEAAPFGRPGWDHVPISKAVQASAALPGLFAPVRIGDHHFVDGALKKTLHATVALDEGVDLMLCINPLVPFNATDPARGIPRIVDGGLPAVLSQTFRSMIHSRMALGMKHYERAYPDTNIVLIEPDQHDAQLYQANTFSYRQRRELAEHAYQQTRALLLARAPALAPRLARHGVDLREDVLREPRQLVARRPHATRVGRAMASLQQSMDDLARLLPPPARQAL
ncbi:patatin-like phospholipase family protein [Ramlibacter sp. Leaf400]|uniref:patatin-like phospholipase family protein n=1 Tax=Ramlibacter sp. Leaf400 TaxID=1736365 RepID=UPI0006FA5B75|nr:patatin-like phospholipase family protein [Ramlibacter sp. Leaf400]KQT14355.1 patatin [Ramlibacter sp. Leaf400]